MKEGTGELHVAFARHALPGRGYVPLPMCLRVIRQTAAYDPASPPFPFLADLITALHRLTGTAPGAVRGYWAPDSPLSTFHSAHGWVELAIADHPFVALVPNVRPPASARTYPAFVQKTALDCYKEWAQKAL